ncbi:hypothetical protein TNCV_509681 [Trichonephila clavipes]|nr:hypothetical protein TNCV_509681 [Trichonephila clavipes]
MEECLLTSRLKLHRAIGDGSRNFEPRSAEDVKVAHPKNPTTALSTRIKVNHPRLRDGCSGQRVKTIFLRSKKRKGTVIREKVAIANVPTPDKGGHCITSSDIPMQIES